jgi:hypothetical protein
MLADGIKPKSLHPRGKNSYHLVHDSVWASDMVAKEEISVPAAMYLY